MKPETFITVLCIVNVACCIFQYFCLIMLERKIKESKIANSSHDSYYVRIGFVHQIEGGKYAGTCTYWKEEDVVKRASDLGLSVADYLADEYKYYRFDQVTPVPSTEYKKRYLPQRFIVKADTLKKFYTVELSNSNCFTTVNRKDLDDPFMCYWVGIIVASDTPEYISELKKAFHKKEKKQ